MTLPTVLPSKPVVHRARPRVLVPEKISAEGLAVLKPLCDVDVRLGMSAEELVSVIPGYQGLLVRSETKVTPEVLRAGRQLRAVGRAGVGVDNINLPVATAHGIIVINSPSGNTRAAAELTITLMFAVARNIARADAAIKLGKWERSKLVGVEVGGKTLGIVGLGHVGLLVAKMAKGLGMQVKAYDPFASADKARQAGVDLVTGLGDLLPHADFLTIHTPLSAATLNLIGEEELRSMKQTARILNVARGGVINEAALLKALDEGWIAGAGLDVFTSEPLEAESVAAQLAQHVKTVSTPHLGASTKEAQENVSMDVCTQMLEIFRGGLPTSAVNAPIILPEEYRKLQPAVQLAEKMGRLYAQHFARTKEGGIGDQTFDLIYQGEFAGMSNTEPLFAALVKGLVAGFTDHQVNIVNAKVLAKDKGISINEIHAHQSKDMTLSNLLTLKSMADGPMGSSNTEQIIQGYVSGGQGFISKLDRFNATFSPEGALLILHNYDRPGKIGGVGMVLGSNGINIRYMQVASLDAEASAGQGSPPTKEENEALMILGVDGLVTGKILDDLRKSEGVLDVSLLLL